jgi:hypothetical protein
MFACLSTELLKPLLYRALSSLTVGCLSTFCPWVFVVVVADD